LEKIIRNEEIAYRVVNGEAVMLNPIDNQIHLLNDVATFIWLELEEKSDFDELLGSICEEFDVDRSQAYEDLNRNIIELGEKGLIDKLDKNT
jgi:hypothetical protein